MRFVVLYHGEIINEDNQPARTRSAQSPAWGFVNTGAIHLVKDED